MKREPKDRIIVNFYLNQLFLRTQEKKLLQLWRVNTSHITDEGKFFGSVIYEESGTDELQLEFITARVEDASSAAVEENVDDAAAAQKLEASLDFPQRPVPQSWIVDYPLLAYKTYNP